MSTSDSMADDIEVTFVLPKLRNPQSNAPSTASNLSLRTNYSAFTLKTGSSAWSGKNTSSTSPTTVAASSATSVYAFEDGKSRSAARGEGCFDVDKLLKSSKLNLALAAGKISIAAKSEPELASMPQAVIVYLFSTLDDCTATCLALTHKTFYEEFKALKPDTKPSLWELCKIPLLKNEQGPLLISDSAACFQLGELLKDWIGPKYRPRGFGQLHFPYRNMFSAPYYLLIKTYGIREGSEKEMVLLRRYSDYANCLGKDDEGKDKKLLPNPFNKGIAWNKDAKEYVLEDAARRGDWRLWMTYWNGSFIFQSMRYWGKLRVLKELEGKLERDLLNKGGLNVPDQEAKVVLGLKLGIFTGVRWGIWWVAHSAELTPWPEVLLEGQSERRRRLRKQKDREGKVDGKMAEEPNTSRPSRASFRRYH